MPRRGKRKSNRSKMGDDILGFFRKLLNELPPPTPDRPRQPYQLRDEQKALFLEVLREGFRTLARKYHPDAGGTEDQMKQLNQLRDRLQELYGRF